MNAEAVRRMLALVAIGSALCLMLYHEIRVIAPVASHSAQTFLAHAAGLDFPAFESKVGLMDLQRAWKPRLLSNVLGSYATRGAVVDGRISDERFAHLAGLWSASWLALVFLLYLAFLGSDALIPMLGTFAGVAFAYMPGIGDRVYPWDMPSLFFSALFVCLLLHDRLAVMLFFLPIATLFKETAIVMAPAFLFLRGSARKRIAMFGVALLSIVAAKIAADVITDSQGHLAFDGRLLLANVRYAVTGEFPHPEWYTWTSHRSHLVLVNAGLLAAFFLYPFPDRNAWMLRTVVLLYVAGTLTGAVVFEYRTWIGLIPLLLYPLTRAPLAPQEPTPSTARACASSRASASRS